MVSEKIITPLSLFSHSQNFQTLKEDILYKIISVEGAVSQLTCNSDATFTRSLQCSSILFCAFDKSHIFTLYEFERECNSFLFGLQNRNPWLSAKCLFPALLCYRFHQWPFSMIPWELKLNERATVWLSTTQQIWCAEVDPHKEQTDFYVA